MRAALLAGLLAGCNTAAVFDLEAEEVLGVAVPGGQAACDGDGYTFHVVLTNQQGGAVRVGGNRIPALPGSAARALTFRDVQIDGVATTVTVKALEAVVAPDDAVYTVVLDRSGAVCGALASGPWGEQCNFTPCGRPDSEGCTPARGCCPEGQVCAGVVDGRALTQSCVAPADDCDPACGPDAVCHNGACRVRLWGPLDPHDTLVRHVAGTLGRLLDTEGGALSPPVTAAWALVSSEAGLHALSEAPTADLEAQKRALERDLLPAFGAPALLPNLLALDANGPGDGPVLVWALRSGGAPPAEAFDGRPPHIFAVLDSPALSAADDRAFAGASCRTRGAYLRLPADSALDADLLASSWIPAIARARLAARVTLDPAPAPGAHRVRGTVLLDVRAIVGPGSRPPKDRLEQPVDFVLGGAP